MKINVVPVSKEYMTEVVEILQQISEFKPKKSYYEEIFKEFLKHPDNYGLVAVDDVQKVLGFGSILIEYKIRGGVMGHIEDVAIHKQYQNRAIGKKIVDKLVEIGKNKKCYKISLSCKEKNIIFYQKCNFLESGTTMTRFLDY